MKRIYLAGPYNADNVISCLDNIRQGVEVASWLIIEGYAPFCHWLDYLYRIVNPSVTREMYHAQSLAWLEKCDAMLVLPGWESSKGTLVEIAQARELGIPVYYDQMQLKREVSIRE